MSRLLKVQFRGTVSGRADAVALLARAGDVALVSRGRPRLLVMSCPCGCGEQVPVNLDERAGPAWRYYSKGRYGMSLFPSVWRTSGCRSHFIIWNGEIWLLSQAEDSLEYERGSYLDLPSADVVLRVLPAADLAHFSVIAEQLDVVPWDVLTICRGLVRNGLAIEGRGKQTGQFRRR